MKIPYISYLIIAPIILCYCINGACQVKFSRSNHYINNESARSNISVGFSDINGDGWDDIVRLNDGTDLEILLASSNENSFHLVSAGKVINSDAWTTTVGDINNDGINEIMFAGIYTGAFIYEFNGNKLVFNQSTEPSFYSQGSNFVDINNDGWLDLFVCDDEGESNVFINDQNGNLLSDTVIMDLSTTIPSDDSGNYGSEWFDIDNDGDIDLYISKCKANAFDPTDPRRINMLFINDGEGSYSEQAERFGLALSEQSWASSFGDLDNDGDMDGIVINHGDPHILLENTGNDSFVNRSSEIGNIQSLGLQVLTRDFDNNGFLDIYITGDKSFMLWNQGEFNFLVEEKMLDYYNPTSFAIGDHNRDGFLDIYCSYSSGFTNPGPVADILWENQKNDNHFIGFKLNGVSSNRNGIGARVKIFSNWGDQTRDVKSGESYGMMNSLNVHFGIDSSTSIDSVLIHWPSGQTDWFYSLAADSYYSVTEGKCITEYRNLHFDKTRFCETDSAILFSAEDDIASYFWSDKSEENGLITDSTGVYSLLAKDINGCIVPYNPIQTILNPDDEQFEIIAYPGNVACSSDTVLLTTNARYTVNWEDFGIFPEILAEKPGKYKVEMEGACNTYKDSIIVSYLPENQFETSSDTVEKGDTAVLIANGNEIAWYADNLLIAPVHFGDTLSIEDLQQTTSFYVQNTERFTFDTSVIGESVDLSSVTYPPNNTNGRMYFEASQDIVLHAVDVFSGFTGNRTIMLFSGDGDLVEYKTSFVDTGKQTINLDMELPKGKYYLTTSPDSNLTNLGMISPGFSWLNGKPNFPYLSDSGLDIMNSSFGPGFYLYFFDWKFSVSDLICKSDVSEVVAFLDVNSSVQTPEIGQIKIYPNPVSDRIKITYDEQNPGHKIMIFNSLGEKVYETEVTDHFSTNTIDTGYLQAGYYILLIKSGNDKISQASFIKIK